MKQLLLLLIYILFAIAIGYLVYWGGGEVGLPDVPRMIIAGIAFVVLLLFGLSKTGTLEA